MPKQFWKCQACGNIWEFTVLFPILQSVMLGLHLDGLLLVGPQSCLFCLDRRFAWRIRDQASGYLCLSVSIFLAPGIPPHGSHTYPYRLLLVYENGASSTKTLCTSSGACMTQLIVPERSGVIRLCPSSVLQLCTHMNEESIGGDSSQLLVSANHHDTLRGIS